MTETHRDRQRQTEKEMNILSKNVLKNKQTQIVGRLALIKRSRHNYGRDAERRTEQTDGMSKTTNEGETEGRKD